MRAKEEQHAWSRQGDLGLWNGAAGNGQRGVMKPSPGQVSSTQNVAHRKTDRSQFFAVETAADVSCAVHQRAPLQTHAADNNAVLLLAPTAWPAVLRPRGLC